MAEINVLVVEDEPIAREAHELYVGRLDGFHLAASAATAAEALRALADARAQGRSIDLILMDMNLPDLHGLDLARRVRAQGFAVDIIAITASRDIAVVRGAVANGMVQYLIKPFTFATFAEKLSHFRAFSAHLGASAQENSTTNQDDVDAAFAALRTPRTPHLPKGLTSITLDAIRTLVSASPTPLSAAEVAEKADVSRVTARRYLEHLASTGTLVVSPRYGSPGRPENLYRKA